jgi:hypothetical protein
MICEWMNQAEGLERIKNYKIIKTLFVHMLQNGLTKKQR